MAGLWTPWLFGRAALDVFVSLENYATLLIDFLIMLQLILAKNPSSPPAHHFPHQVFHVTFLSCEFYNDLDLFPVIFHFSGKSW